LDNVAVAGVQFLLDGAPLGAEDTTAPYGISWNTTTVANGQYVLSAGARDAAGNQATSSSITITVSNTAAPSGLVLALGFNEGTGVTVADASGNGNAGALNSATWSTAGRFGNALSFNGSSALVTVNDSNSLDLTTGMTLEAWVNPSVVNSAWRDVIYKGNDNYYLEATSTNGSRPAAGAIINGSYAEGYGSAPLAVNTWTHLASTYDGTVFRLYVNGSLVSSSPATGTIATSANPLQIGGDSIYGQHFAGLIDEVRIYNRALSASEIQADMNTAVQTIAGGAATIAAGIELSEMSFMTLPGDLNFDLAIEAIDSAMTTPAPNKIDQKFDAMRISSQALEVHFNALKSHERQTASVHRSRYSVAIPSLGDLLLAPNRRTSFYPVSGSLQLHMLEASANSNWQIGQYLSSCDALDDVFAELEEASISRQL
jgi:hypothetical protein